MPTCTRHKIELCFLKFSNAASGTDQRSGPGSVLYPVPHPGKLENIQNWPVALEQPWVKVIVEQVWFAWLLVGAAVGITLQWGNVELTFIKYIIFTAFSVVTCAQKDDDDDDISMTINNLTLRRHGSTGSLPACQPATEITEHLMPQLLMRVGILNIKSP